MDRGILTTAYATPAPGVDAAAVMTALRECYANEPFVRVVDGLPATKDVVGHELLRHHGPRSCAAAS